MKHIPILYSTPMVQAKLEKRKTQTRRLKGLDKINASPNEWEFVRFFDGYAKLTEKHNALNEVYVKCPYGQPGDVLWVRETWCRVSIDHAHDLLEGRRENDLYARPSQFHSDWMLYAKEKYGYKWKPSIHMPKAACRMWNMVKYVGVERIADISRLDCLAEGIMMHVELEDTPHETTYYQYEFGGTRYATAREAFRALWQSINGKPTPIQEKQNGKLVTVGYEIYPFDEYAGKTWKHQTTYRGKPLTVCINPWVWVVEFEPCAMPEDFLTR